MSSVSIVYCRIVKFIVQVTDFHPSDVLTMFPPFYLGFHGISGKLEESVPSCHSKSRTARHDSEINLSDSLVAIEKDLLHTNTQLS